MYTLIVHVDDSIVEIDVNKIATLREVLLDNDLSPYATLTNRLNCGGRGVCATCGVWLMDDVQPNHWHDKAANLFGYPRLSCQIEVNRDMAVRLITDKVIWGKRDSNRAKFLR